MIHQVYFYIVLRLLAILYKGKKICIREDYGYAFKEKDKKYIVGKYFGEQ